MIPASQLEDIGLDVAQAGHSVCCRNEERILCGARWHPEIVLLDDEELCKRCEEMLDLMECPPKNPTHRHCPFTGSVCPEF